jgi:hypothetical protein
MKNPRETVAVPHSNPSERTSRFKARHTDSFVIDDNDQWLGLRDSLLRAAVIENKNSPDSR